jgi:hypothetical protein
MAVQHIKTTVLRKLGRINWYTPTHRLYRIGKGQDLFFAGRIKKPEFLICGDTQAEVELEAGRLINASLE